MPYILKKQRVRFDPIIDSLYSRLTNNNKTNFDPGELNYIISKLVWKLFDNNPRYKTGNDLVGCLECIKQEFIRRRLNEYENEKINENGDIL